MVTFTDRERRVLKLHKQGKSDAAIAMELGVYRSTVQRARERALAKLAELRKAAEAYDRGELIEFICNTPA